MYVHVQVQYNTTNNLSLPNPFHFPPPQIWHFMHLLSVFVLAIVIAAGTAIRVTEEEEPLIILQDTGPDLLTPSIIIKKARNDGEDSAAVMMADSSDTADDLVPETACSPPSSNQRRGGRGKIRRGNTCSTPDGWSRDSPPKGQQEFHDGQSGVPYQMAPAEESPTPGDSSARAAGDGSDDPKLACNPMLVGMNRQVAVCDMGRALNRILNINIRMPTVWPIGTTYPGGSYTVEDVTFCKPHHMS